MNRLSICLLGTVEATADGVTIPVKRPTVRTLVSKCLGHVTQAAANGWGYSSHDAWLFVRESAGACVFAWLGGSPL